MKKGDLVYTPRFCTCQIQKVFTSRENAYKQGYTEPTHYDKDGYTVYGKHTGINRMIFAGIKL